MGAKGVEIGVVKSPSGSNFTVFWNSSTGEVHVNRESAGLASSSGEAMRKADYYATTGRKMS